MKRIGHIFDQIVSIENLREAHLEAKYGKTKRHRSVARFEEHLEENLQHIRESLLNGTWKMRDYRRLDRYEGHKWRTIYYDPHYEDTVVQHAIGRTLGKRLTTSFILHTYASIQGRGIHRAVKHIKRHLKTYKPTDSIYIFKCDLHHFYQSIDHDVLKTMLASKIKDKRALQLLFTGVIDTFPEGLPIGNYLSPLLANFFLSELDHLMTAQVRGYFRYLDDIVLIDTDKQQVRAASDKLMRYCGAIHMTLKENHQLFPIERYGLDYLGYVFRRFDIRLRRRVERQFRHAVRLYIQEPCEKALQSLASYWGWLRWATGGMQLWHSLVGSPIDTLWRTV